MPETSYYGGIHSIAKDSVGRIWFSGYDALFMYNGSAFVRMDDLVTSLSPSSYWNYGQVVTDHRGGLYVGTNHGLLRFDYGSRSFEPVLDGNIGSVMVNGDGTVWLIRNNDIESFDPERLPELVRYERPPDCSVSSLALICTREYVYAATKGNLYRLNRETGQYTLFTTVGGDGCVIRDVVEYGGSVYVLTLMDGLYECDGDGRVTQYFRLPVEYEKSAGAKELFLDTSGIIWVATQSGLLLLDPATGSTHLLRSNLHYPYSLPNNSVWSIFPDPDGGVWVGTYGGKLAYMTLADNGVNYFKATPGGLNHPIVSCFEEDDAGNLWIGTEGGGLNYWDRKNDRFVYYTQESRSGITSNMIKRLRYDRDGRLLISAFNGGIKLFDARRGRFTDLRMYCSASPQPLSIYDFVQEGDSGIWLTNPDAELMYGDAGSGTVETVYLTDDRGNEVRPHVETLFHDGQGRLWLVTHDGAYVVDAASRRILAHYYLEDAPYSENNLCSYCVTSGSEIWFGTRGGGVNLLSRDGEYANFKDRTGEGLSGKTVFGILEDTVSKNVWFSTNSGLYYYDYVSRMIRKSQIDSPNLCGAYYVRACYKTSRGEMLFGGTDGFILFNPGKIGHNEQKPKVFFTDLLINSEPVKPGVKDSPLRRSITTMACDGDDGSAIELSHRQSNLEICFSANSYLDVGKNQYAYRMLGLSERWSLLLRGQKAVQFFNLPAGSYVFEVKAANNDGLWGDEVSSLRFEVSPSPFLSRWAYAVYAMLLLAVASFIWRYFTDRKIFEQRLELERIKEQNMKELTQARINFFTNISHDLKTPLTLVVDPLKQLKQHLPVDAPCSDYVRLIEKNVGRIQRMISQLLQFREIESQKMTLNRQPGDLIRFIDSIFSLFEFYASKKGIETDFSSRCEGFYTSFDHDVIEKIFTNLLAAESMVLLKNEDDVLPLKGVRRIAVVGPIAKSRYHLLGSWSSKGDAEDVVSVFAGLEAEYGDKAELLYAQGCNFDGEDASGFGEAVAAASAADIVVLCLGEKRDWSGENASRSSIALPEIQERLARELAKTGKPIVLVLSSGRPLELCRLEPLSAAIVQMWQPGLRGGGPLAGILAGRINPSGRLAMTFPYSTGQIPIYYNHRQSARTHQGKYQDIPSTPLYGFGHGLSYTTFEYGDLKPSAVTFRRGDKVMVEIAVTNTGKMDGAETVHWFVSDPVCMISRPVRELKHFEKQPIRCGETHLFRFEIDPERDLSFTDGDGRRFLEPGDYYVIVKDRKVKLTLTE